MKRAAQAGVRAARAGWYGWRGADFGLSAKAGAGVGRLGSDTGGVVRYYFRKKESSLKFTSR